ncbi:hypothetical protein LmNIHS28_01531 [Listeria monocytogenes]|nr:hypothetical protein F2382_02282 [Listeria monocytogenes]GAM95599.1 hypothetical protein LmNIHS28_01531 [Listeria monocytogenes]
MYIYSQPILLLFLRGPLPRPLKQTNSSRINHNMSDNHIQSRLNYHPHLISQKLHLRRSPNYSRKIPQSDSFPLAS